MAEDDRCPNWKEGGPCSPKTKEEETAAGAGKEDAAAGAGKGDSSNEDDDVPASAR